MPYPVASVRNKGSTLSVFSPSNLANLIAWYDFGDITTLFKDTGRTVPVTADGDAIAGVTDKGLNGYHLSQSIANRQPTYKVNIQNGKSVVRFAGFNGTANTGDCLTHASASWAQSTYIFMVIRPSVQATQHNIIDGTQGGDRQVVFVNTSGNYALYAGTLLTSTTPASTTTADLVTSYFNGNSSLIRVDGSQIQSGAAGALGNSKIFISGDSAGATQYNGDICEIIVVPSVSASVVTDIEAYLNAKWAVF